MLPENRSALGDSMSNQTDTTDHAAAAAESRKTYATVVGLGLVVVVVTTALYGPPKYSARAFRIHDGWMNLLGSAIDAGGEVAKACTPWIKKLVPR